MSFLALDGAHDSRGGSRARCEHFIPQYRNGVIHHCNSSACENSPQHPPHCRSPRCIKVSASVRASARMGDSRVSLAARRLRRVHENPQLLPLVRTTSPARSHRHNRRLRYCDSCQSHWEEQEKAGLLDGNAEGEAMSDVRALTHRPHADSLLQKMPSAGEGEGEGSRAEKNERARGQRLVKPVARIGSLRHRAILLISCSSCCSII